MGDKRASLLAFGGWALLAVALAEDILTLIQLLRPHLFQSLSISFVLLTKQQWQRRSGWSIDGALAN